jgi:glycosyltransferase involved in cell wall biosynthesis
MIPPASGGAPVLGLIVPAFNEEALLESTVESLVESLKRSGAAVEIILVDDGSADRTGEIADRLAGSIPGVSAVHQENQGIGGAFRTGTAHGAAPYVMLWPADMPAEPADLAAFLEAIGRADVIVGCRRRRLGYSAFMRWNSWLYRVLVGALFGIRLRDVNWIHAYRREQFAKLELRQRGIPMLAETLVRLRDAGASMTEVDVDMKPRAAGVASAGCFLVMWRTLSGLIRFWFVWRKERRADRSRILPA